MNELLDLIHSLDVVLNAQLAGTLAGLTVAAASLLMGSASEIGRERMELLRQLNRLKNDQSDRPSDQRNKLIQEEMRNLDTVSGRYRIAKLATKNMHLATLCFLGSLIEALTLDPIASEGLISWIGYQGLVGVDLAVASGTMGFGVYFLIQAARDMKKLQDV